MIEATDVRKKEFEFKRLFAALDDNTKSVLWDFFNLDYWPLTEKNGDDLVILINSTFSYRLTLILKNASGIPCDKYGYYFYTKDFVYDQNTNCYSIHGDLDNPYGDSSVPFTLTFESAEAMVQVCNAVEGCLFYNDPWETLRTIALHISLKAELSDTYCNEAELTLLPLIKEIVAVGYWRKPKFKDYIEFTELKSLSEKYNFHKITTLLTALEAEEQKDKKFTKLVKKLMALLCKNTYEPFWRDIYEKLKNSQKDYPNIAELHISSRLLNKVRNKIQKLMESHGYVGIYPDFIKNGTKRGIHLVDSYNLTYFAFNEKRVRYHIHCIESINEEGHLNLQFLCGTAFLKKGEKVHDIYSCCFNANGRRVFRNVVFDTSTPEHDIKPDLTQFVSIAIKKAELLKLTKEERKAYNGTASLWGLFWFWLIIGGGLFSIFFNLCMMLLIAIILTIFGEFSSILDLFQEIPWHWFITFAWIGFGGSIGLITVLAKNK